MAGPPRPEMAAPKRPAPPHRATPATARPTATATAIITFGPVHQATGTSEGASMTPRRGGGYGRWRTTPTVAEPMATSHSQAIHTRRPTATGDALRAIMLTIRPTTMPALQVMETTSIGSTWA